jgi:hypothetical protein
VAGSNRLLNPFFLSVMFFDRKASSPIMAKDEAKKVINRTTGFLFCMLNRLKKLTTSPMPVVIH